MPVWLQVALGVLGGSIPLIGWLRRFEKTVDRHDTFLFGETGANGVRKRLNDLEEWKEDFKANLPNILHDERHNMRGEMHKAIAAAELKARGG